jgi:TetR/AcrR family transcriptional repressor of nem operon
MKIGLNTLATTKRRGRPPKILRENQDTKAELIRSGLEHLTEYGFSSSGIEPILKKVGVPKGSFYHYFDNKETFGQAVIQKYASYFINKLDVFLLDESYPPLVRISNFVESAKAGMERHQFKRGCLVGNLGQEVDLLPESFRPQLIDILLSWQQRLSSCLKMAQRQGSISATANCELLAECFWVGWEGAVSRAKLVQNSKPLENYLSHFMMALPR